MFKPVDMFKNVIIVFFIIAPNCTHPVVYRQSNGLTKYDIFTQ